MAQIVAVDDSGAVVAVFGVWVQHRRARAVVFGVCGSFKSGLLSC